MSRPPGRLLTQGEIEDAIVGLSENLEALTYTYSDLSDLAAETEADYKIKHSRALVGFAADPGIKMTAAEKQARVDVHCAAELRAWKMAEARRQSTKEALLSIRARLDAMRTLSANVRHQT